jgi:GTPase SAR1 family protein
MKNNFLENELLKLHYKDNYKPQTENIVCKIENSVIGTLGNFIIFSGLPKSGKSTFINALIASSFSNLNIFKLKLELNFNSYTIGYFDTESSEMDFYNNISRIKYIGGDVDKLPNFINVFSTRKKDATENRKLIEYYILRWKPKIVVIDGLLDLIDNFNNEVESKIIINWLKKLTDENNVLIIGVIHTGKKDNFTLGHFGSMLDRYSQSVLDVTRNVDENIYTLSPKYLRSAKEYFTPFSIQWTGTRYHEVMYHPDAKKSGK